MLYRWSNPSELYGKFSQRRGFDSKIYFIRQVSRYFLRCFLARRQISEFVEFVNQHESLIRFFERYGGDYRVVCVNFADRLLSLPARLDLLIYNLSFVVRLPETLFEKFLQNQEEVIFEDAEGFRIVLKINGTFEEGFFAIELKLGKIRVYGASFCFVPVQMGVALLIPSLAGLSYGEETKKSIKTITKNYFGLQPQKLLVEIMRFLMLYKGCCALLGIPQELQVRYPSFGKKRAYFVDYDEMWKACGGVKKGRYFDLTQKNRKSLEMIPSNKRSMYKRRFAFLDLLQDAFDTKIKEIGF